ncbi:SprT domain-containing protein [Cardiosporidium cionae]|uniref:SprT domain-containing protein n=1 Tax=Cardiosporidium cionae TaxID=476202 RepID=A0ABQ7JAY0_9APIC|nr:SprT domain-containing protein [Cardiosporidium cionae]|eukprot:KAF8821157.1 SprT domain-containing protein [Cardiosporidium cionae]
MNLALQHDSYGFRTTIFEKLVSGVTNLKTSRNDLTEFLHLFSLDTCDTLFAYSSDVSILDDMIKSQLDASANTPPPIIPDNGEFDFPDIHRLFTEYNCKYFWDDLNSVSVRWSSKMTLCAGLCLYVHGACSIRLSEPLLKYRSIQELKETLLHEMIHAFLFVTQNKRDHSAHGPEFRKHMNRINSLTGMNITVFHNFGDEVDYYRKHIWRCDGPCRYRSPYFGFVKRAMNRPPGKYDFWWNQHQLDCGGSYAKISEPVQPIKLKKGKACNKCPNLDMFLVRKRVKGGKASGSQLKHLEDSTLIPVEETEQTLSARIKPQPKDSDIVIDLGESDEEIQVVENVLRSSSISVTRKLDFDGVLFEID